MEVLPDLRATQQTATCKAQKQPEEVPKSLCEYKLIFTTKQSDVRKRSTNSTECLMITFKVVIASKIQHLSIADTSENHGVCVCVSSQLFAAHTHGQEPCTYSEILISSTCTEHLFS